MCFFFNVGFLYQLRPYLTDELPQAPCLSVRMLTIFWMSWVEVMWSRNLAALIKWSHIFSSSRFSAAYWAQFDWKGKEKNKSESKWSHILPKFFKGMPLLIILKYKICSYTHTHTQVQTRVEIRDLQGPFWINGKRAGHFCPCVMLINNSGHAFSNALQHTVPQNTGRTFFSVRICYQNKPLNSAVTLPEMNSYHLINKLKTISETVF